MRGQRYLCFTEVFYRKHKREETEKKHHIIFWIQNWSCKLKQLKCLVIIIIIQH